MQILVALSALGALHCNIFCSSRLFFVGARNDHLPKALALINLNKLTPIPAIVFIVFKIFLKMNQLLIDFNYLILYYNRAFAQL